MATAVLDQDRDMEAITAKGYLDTSSLYQFDGVVHWPAGIWDRVAIQDMCDKPTHHRVVELVEAIVSPFQGEDLLGEAGQV
jgi:hypothetical protein